MEFLEERMPRGPKAKDATATARKRRIRRKTREALELVDNQGLSILTLDDDNFFFHK
jgi:hypothetical protein